MKQAMLNYTMRGVFDEINTPKCAVDPILRFIPENKIIWCPFDTEKSNYVESLKKKNDVIYSHKNNNKNFFEYEPTEWDIIISNPPFSLKDDIFLRCFELGKPFALLLPLTALEGIKRGKMFRKYGVQILVLDKRVNFMDQKKNNWFNTSYFCWQLLPRDLIFHQCLF